MTSAAPPPLPPAVPPAGTPAETPAVVVHDLAQARAAVAAADGRPLALLTPPGAAFAHGVGFWAAVRRALGPPPPILWVDCADAPGYALAALRGGVAHLILRGHCEATRRVARLAAAAGGAVLGERPPALDLLGAADPHAAVAALLAADAAEQAAPSRR
jgi:hypothetical protein